MQIKNIEFLRLFFTLVVVYGHLMQWFIFPHFIDVPIISSIKNNFTYNFGVVVEMFFILSGFFMFRSFNKPGGQKSWLHFTKNKIIRLWPVLAFAIVALGILSLFHMLKFEKYPNILSLFFIDAAGFTEKLSNSGYAWYVSAMFWALLFYYYLLKKISTRTLNLTIALTTYIAYVLLLPKADFSVRFQYGILPTDIIRGLAGVGLGYFIGQIVYLFKLRTGEPEGQKQQSKKQFFFISIAEIYLFFYLANNLLIHDVSSQSRLVFIIPFCVLFILFLMKRGLLSQLTEINIIDTVGKYSYSIYIMQIVIFILFSNMLFNNPIIGVRVYPVLNIIFTMSACIILGIATHYFIEKPGASLLNKLFTKINYPS